MYKSSGLNHNPFPSLAYASPVSLTATLMNERDGDE